MVHALGSFGQTSESTCKNKPKKRRQNGGKYGFDDYTNAPITTYEVEGCAAGSRCEVCGLGRYYSGECRKKITFRGGAIVQAERHLQKTLRCNRCGHEKMTHFKHEKWTPEARSSIVIQKLYGTHWHRMSRIQKLYGFPIAMSTLWEQSRSLWEESAQFIVERLQYYRRA